MSLKMGSSFNEPKQELPQSKQINERTVTETTNDGCIIEKKIVEYPSEETIEIEEIEEVDGKIMSVKRSIVGEKKQEPSWPKALVKLDNEPVLSVPACRSVSMDEKTNSTTVTEKTTTGYKQTVTVTQEDGTKKIKTKSYFDPVEIPGKEEKEEPYDEIETFEPGWKRTTLKSIASVDNVKLKCTELEEQSASNTEKPSDNTTVVNKDIELISDPSILAKEEEKLTLSSALKNVVIVPGHRKVEFDEKNNTTTVTEKTTTGYQQTKITVTPDGNTVHTKVFYDPFPGEETGEEVPTAKPTSKKIQTKSSTTNSHVVESVISGKCAEKDKIGEQIEEELIQPIQKQEHKIVKKNVYRVESNSMKTTYVNDLQIVPPEPTLTQKKTQNSQIIPQGEQQENKSQIDVLTKTTSKTTSMQHRSEVKYQVNDCAKVSETKTETKQSTTEANITSTKETQTYTKTEIRQCEKPDGN